MEVTYSPARPQTAYGRACDKLEKYFEVSDGRPVVVVALSDTSMWLRVVTKELEQLCDGAGERSCFFVERACRWCLACALLGRYHERIVLFQRDYDDGNSKRQRGIGEVAEDKYRIEHRIAYNGYSTESKRRRLYREAAVDRD